MSCAQQTFTEREPRHHTANAWSVVLSALMTSTGILAMGSPLTTVSLPGLDLELETFDRRKAPHL